MVNKEFLKEWVEALRSGKYKQCVEQLRNYDEDSYCCLGVMCELKGVEGQNIEELDPTKPEFDEDLEFSYVYKFSNDLMDNKEIPNNIFIEWTGLPPGAKNKFIIMNDEDGASFTEIADYVENQYIMKE